jgi:D-lactate dehydrogenase
MKTIVFSSKPYDRQYLEPLAKENNIPMDFVEASLKKETAALAEGYGAVSVFVNDTVDADVIKKLAELKVKLIALRCAGFNNVDLSAAEEYQLCVFRVPAYSPNAVAEYAVAMMLTLNRKTHRSYTRVRENNFALNGLLGFDMLGKKIGIIGTGKIGTIAARILKHGFQSEILAYDVHPNKELEEEGIVYADLKSIAAECDIISLHCPLTPETRHLVNKDFVDSCKPGMMIINTSRGKLIDTTSVIEGLKNKRIGALGIDVYEEEGDLFFQDLSNEVIYDDTFSRLTTFPNVLVSGHLAFFTHEAMTNIAQTTIDNIISCGKGECINALSCAYIKS